MKIKYKILWVEDHLETIKPFVEGLTRKLEECGFTLDVTKKKTLNDKELIELRDVLSDYNPYDMIIFDYDLGDGKNGDDIACSLRNIIYTDMIFYSGVNGSGLRKLLYEKKVDGVFIVDRSNFIDDAWSIIEDQVKRICDINSMRGVLLDEMSEIDLKIRRIYKQKYDGLLSEGKEAQLKKFKNILKGREEVLKKQREVVDEGSFSEIIEKPTKVEFNTVRMWLESVTDNEAVFGESSALKEKQVLRNKFAHNRANYDDVKGIVTLEGFEEKYGFGEFAKIRKELVELSKEIDEVK